MGIVGTATALLLTATVAFARDDARPATSSMERLQTVRAEVRSRIDTEREKVSQRLTDIQDKAKREMAQRLAGQFDRLNETWTDHFMQQLDTYDALMRKIQARADAAQSAGNDVARTTVAIQSAASAIETARTAVTAQAAKTYELASSTIPMIATSTADGQQKILQSLRKSFQTLHTTLFKDLFALRDGPMKNARKAVQAALQTLGGTTGADGENATSTAKRPSR
ncbi:TPA: hypothetical protein DIV48_03685 [Candidatus Kaiserbacteria bacterium]|nr:MAG: hypothetical protein UY93_C0002G0464 [Parcubacteria group bacterium GW2011_GWA1_56_13]KKW46640.1 MAG: hypothetical protein UY97_C0004G0029 [Parcubacteria group bacterium GW2011_GWB1_57_6]HCR52714.1 hypothetical protein [Candidatus Kaiserbacteria bacterium]